MKYYAASTQLDQISIFSLVFMHNNQVPCGRRLHFKIISSSMMTTYRTLFLDNYRKASHIEFQRKKKGIYSSKWLLRRYFNLVTGFGLSHRQV